MSEAKAIGGRRGSSGPREHVREARSALYRQLIFEAAERSFAEKGVEETKMEAIASDAGLSLGTLYSVFSGKAELVAAIHATRLDAILQRSEAAVVDTNDPLERVMQGVRSYVEFFVSHPDYLQMHLREGSAWGLGGLPDSTRQQAEAFSKGLALQAKLFEAGIAAGVFYAGDPQLLARMMIAMQQVQLADWVDRGMSRSPEDLVAEMTEQVRRSFCPPLGDQPGQSRRPADQTTQ